MDNFRIDPVSLTGCWSPNAGWRHPAIKFAVIVRLFTFHCGLRQEAISWRTFVLRFPRWPWLHVERRD